jgi:hypothetical protein
MFFSSKAATPDAIYTFVSRRLQEIVTEALLSLRTGTLDQKKFFMKHGKLDGGTMAVFYPGLAATHMGDTFVVPFILGETIPDSIVNAEDIQAMQGCVSINTMFDQMENFINEHASETYTDGYGGESEAFEIAYLDLWVLLMELDQLLVGYVVQEDFTNDLNTVRTLHLFLKRDFESDPKCATCNWTIRIASPKGVYIFPEKT